MTPAPEPFGAYRPAGAQALARRLAAALPAERWARLLVSLCLTASGGRRARPQDVAVFGALRARLHPFDNLSEKRVFIAPQFWEARERALLAEAIRACRAEAFWFLDIGCNAGLYTLFAHAEALAAGRRLRALCIEPDPVMRARAQANFGFSGFAPEALLGCAVVARAGPVGFRSEPARRGESRIDAGGALEVPGRPLAELVGEWDPPRLDALKIDIEGGEGEVLDAFFASAPPQLWPGLLIAEDRGAGLQDLLGARGYRLRLATRLNRVFTRTQEDEDGVS